MTEIQPIITLAVNYPYTVAPLEPIPQIAFVFQWLGIPMTTATLLLVMFAGWGIWHWVIMAINAGQALPKFVKIIKRYLDKSQET